MTAINADGLFIKFGREAAQPRPGGEVQSSGGKHEYRFKLDYTEALSATPALLDGPIAGSMGVMLPKGLFIEEVEIVTETAFTSSGTIASSTLQIGLIREDMSTTYSNTALTTASFTGGNIDAAGEKNVLRIGSTGVGALVGTTLAHDGYVIVANTAHASHPFTAGKAMVTVRGYFPVA